MPALPDMLLETLNLAPGPVEIFFRNDDAGWDNVALLRLLDVFAQRRLPIDLAIIPTALDEPLGGELRSRHDSGHLLGLHQHGYSHQNHEAAGRKCEFGPSRPAALQRQDLANGRALLRRQFADRLDDIFTPPWNRCSVVTRGALQEIGIRTISQTADDCGLSADALQEVPVTLDWQKPRWPKRPRTAREPIGIMLHHAVMDRDDLQALNRLLGRLLTHKNARPRLMRALGKEPCPI